MIELIIIPTLVFCAFLGFAKFVFSKEKNLGRRTGKSLEFAGQQFVLNMGCLVLTLVLVGSAVVAALTLLVMRLWS